MESTDIHKLQHLTGHVYAFSDQPEVDRPWIGYVAGRDLALLIDAGNSPDHAAAMQAELAARGLATPDIAVLTHSHWDHSYGLSGWNCKAYAGVQTCELLRRMQDWKWTKEAFEERIAANEIPLFCKPHMLIEYPNLEGICIRVPENTIEDEMEIPLGDISCRCIPVTSPHTDDCVIYLIPEERVLFIGDAYCEEVIGTDWIDRPEHRKAFIRKVSSLEFDWCVTGHSGIMTKEEVLIRYGSI